MADIDIAEQICLAVDEIVKKISDIKLLEDLTESLKNYEKIINKV